MDSHKREEATANDRDWKSGVLTEQEQRARWPKQNKTKGTLEVLDVVHELMQEPSRRSSRW